MAINNSNYSNESQFLKPVRGRPPQGGRSRASGEVASNGLNPQQKEAAMCLAGPLLVAAGAGSGKTRVLTSRLLKLIEAGVDPEKIVAVTFTNKAAKEMADRVRIKTSFIGTLHSFGVQILKKETGWFGRKPNFSIYDEDDSLRLIKRILKKINVDSEQFPAAVIQDKISRAKNELITAAKYQPGDDENPLEKIAGRVFRNYELALKDSNAFDFDDLIEKPVRLFKKQPKILGKYQKQFQHLLIDEYQDINTSQYWLLKLLAENHQNICAVGDDNQAIYSFRGADFRNFLNFEKYWPKAKLVLLEENYRSSANIINAASAVIGRNQFQKPKTLWTKSPPGELITITKTDNPEEEAFWIAEEILKMTNDDNDGKIALLYRTNAQSRALEQALMNREIPYEIFGGIRFYGRKEIKDIVAGLRFGLNPKDEISWERLLKISKSAARLLREILPEAAKKEKILDLIGVFIETSSYFKYLENNFRNFEERMDNVNEFVRFASAFQNFQPPLGLQLFLQQAALAQPQDFEKNTRVKLMTIHLSKGLEFDAVFIAGCDEGILPHHRSFERQEDIEEERRLFYVGMTRAKDKLYLTFSQTPSRFLYEAPPELIGFINLANPAAEFDDEENYIEYH